ncbi:MAG TPA: DUF3293 domain-containing protein [Pirellulaceae bacterium]|nr:DUF3293 domain-containing protein [Pirellulaceae bacterium]
MTALDAALIAAYRDAEYVVLPPVGDPVVLRIGQTTSDLAGLLPRLDGAARSPAGSVPWAFLTACNPFSVPLAHDENLRRLGRLRTELASLGLPFCDGFGRDPEGQWLGEPSLFVLNLEPAAACAVGRRWEQHAIVAGTIDGIARLWRCDDDADLTEST